MAIGDLAQLSDVKAWLNITTTDNDALLSRLITAASRMINNYTERNGFYIRTVTDIFDGGLTNKNYMTQYPVISIISVTLNGQALAPQTSPPYGSGYFLEPWDGQDASGPQALYIYGNAPVTALLSGLVGQNNLYINYKVGYQAVETFELEATTTYQTIRPWSSDEGVSYTGGQPLVAVTTAPAVGQYTVVDGLYTFNSGDENKSLTVTYGYTPEDLQQACIELVGERFRARQRIGMTSQSLAGQEVTAFSQKSMNDFIAESIGQFRYVGWNQ